MEMSERASRLGPQEHGTCQGCSLFTEASVLASGFTVSPTTDNVSFEWQETWYPLSQYCGASPSCNWVWWASSVSGVGRLSHVIRLKCLEGCTSSPQEARFPQLGPKPSCEDSGFSIWPHCSHPHC